MARGQVTVAGTPSTETVLAAASMAARLTIAEKVRSDGLTYQEITQVAAIFPPWQPDLAVAVGELYTHAGTLVECVQSHTTQADWAPDVTPALWKVYRDPDAIEPWVQPESTNPYPAGAKVTHNGSTWISDVDGNVWEPGVYGWTQV